MSRPRAYLVLENGTIFEGWAFGATDKNAVGEVGRWTEMLFRVSSSNETGNLERSISAFSIH